jgi:molecular chaperone GrpE
MSDTEMEGADLVQTAVEQKTAEQAILKQSLDEAKAQAADYYDQILRLKAEFENFRKRSERERADARRWGKEEMVGRLVSLMDVLEQAEAAAHKGADLKSVTIGLDMLYKEFKKLLKEEGLEEIPAETGSAFDHSVHEAVDTVEDGGEENRVLGIFQRGYRLNGNLLRPARVKVSRKHSGGESANLGGNTHG